MQEKGLDVQHVKWRSSSAIRVVESGEKFWAGVFSEAQQQLRTTTTMLQQEVSAPQSYALQGENEDQYFRAWAICELFTAHVETMKMSQKVRLKAEQHKAFLIDMHVRYAGFDAAKVITCCCCGGGGGGHRCFHTHLGQ
jgi:hypothetical protein